MAPLFPFSAVVGQDDFKLALLVNAVDPAIGGVLAAGQRGSAKSTLARSLAQLIAVNDAPFVELPLGASIDRVTGSIDTVALIGEGDARLRRGLLATADGGVLYVDEVNLLGDHLVDVLLDAAAFGRVRVERDGLSGEYDTRFVLVGTMNPEEGDLRPQLLDRFGLYAAIEAPVQQKVRTEIVARRLAFERDPAAFAASYADIDAGLSERVACAQEGLTAVDLVLELLEAITLACTRLGVEGLRADIVVARTAIALAALDRRECVVRDDVVTAAKLALPHRAISSPGEANRLSPAEITRAFEPDEPETRAGRSRHGGPNRKTVDRDLPAATAQSDGSLRPRTIAGRDRTANKPHSLPAAGSQRVGRGAIGSDGAMRPAVDAIPVSPDDTGDLDVLATARAAVTRQLLGGVEDNKITAADLRVPVRAGREARLVLCVIDASSSALEDGHGTVLRDTLADLVVESARKRDRIGLVVFRGREARLVAPPSRNHAAVLAGIETIESGGTTPLAEGLRVARITTQRELRRNPDLRPVVALVTDGYANVGRGDDALRDATAEARALVGEGVRLIVIGDPDSDAPRFALQTGARFQPFKPDSDERRIA